MKILIIENSNNRTITYEREYKNKNSKYKGVMYKHNRKSRPWIVRLMKNNKSLHVGCFESEDLAALVYDHVAPMFIEEPIKNMDLYPELMSHSLPITIIEELSDRITYLKELVKSNKPINKISNRYVLKTPKIKIKKIRTPAWAPRVSKESIEDVLYMRQNEACIKVGLDHKEYSKHLKYYEIQKPSKIDKKIYKLNISKEVFNSYYTQCGGSLTKLRKMLKLSEATIKGLMVKYDLHSSYLIPEGNIKRNCPVCKRIFTTNKVIKKFCSSKCQYKSDAKRHAKKARLKHIKLIGALVCKRCGVKFCTLIPIKKSFCSIKCRDFKACIKCGTLSKKKTCEQCIKINKEEKLLKIIQDKKLLKETRKLRVFNHTCIQCEKYFKSNRSSQQCCSTECSKELKSIQHRKWRSNPKNKQKMRIAKKLYDRQVSSKERRNIRKELKAIRLALNTKRPKKNEINLILKRLELFGHNICSYCNTDVGEDKNNQTIDHLLPVCSGGDNSTYNLYLACRQCNQSKWYQEWLTWFRSQSFYSKERELEILKYNIPDWEKLIDD